MIKKNVIKFILQEFQQGMALILQQTMETKKKLTRKVEISQGGKSVIFRLSEKEYQSLRRSSRYTAKEPIPSVFGMCYNSSMYAFFYYETSRSKSGRFHKEFNYHGGDFNWYLITE